MHVAILGRQPKIGMAELERVYGNVSWFSDISACIETDMFDIERLGGTLKAGRVVAETSGDWRRVSMRIVKDYVSTWTSREGKITLGISAYGFDVSAREVQKTGIVLKQKLREHGVSLRLVPQDEPALSTATSHHNKLGLSGNKVELLVIRGYRDKVIVAESTGAQNITAYTKRDQERPKRDAFVGMLPPKLAQIMINLAPKTFPNPDNHSLALLDPFCGTGVIPQEALLFSHPRFEIFGTDLNSKMIEYTLHNLKWFEEKFETSGTILTFGAGDATSHRWLEATNLDCIVSETYLGQPFSAPPSPAKLREVRDNCNHIITEFLKNIGHQVRPGTGFCLAVPAWRATDGSFTHLPVIENLGALGYKVVGFKNLKPEDLLYYREGQVVARELLVLTKA